MWGLKLDQWLLLLNERDSSVTEVQFRLELLLSAGAILFVTDKTTDKYIQARSDLKTDMFLRLTARSRATTTHACTEGDSSR